MNQNPGEIARRQIQLDEGKSKLDEVLKQAMNKALQCGSAVMRVRWDAEGLHAELVNVAISESQAKDGEG